MDSIEGAKILRERLGEESEEERTLAPAGAALPIYLWCGVEPPADLEPAPAAPPARRRRFGRFAR
jgi:hypothetical protein